LAVRFTLPIKPRLIFCGFGVPRSEDRVYGGEGGGGAGGAVAVFSVCVGIEQFF